jgi:hypothetical protein
LKLKPQGEEDVKTTCLSQKRARYSPIILAPDTTTATFPSLLPDSSEDETIRLPSALLIKAFPNSLGCREETYSAMDVFKLAFETMIVGILSFAWLAIAVDLLFPDFFVKLIQPVWDKNQTSIGAAVLSFAYCLGSAIMPISGQLVNDEHWPLPEFAIRCRVMQEENGRLNDIRQNTELLSHYRSTEDLNVCPRSFWAISSLEDGKMHPWNFAWRLFLRAFRVGDGHLENDPNANKQLTLFQLYETKVLSQGSASTDNTEFFRQLHERIVVLRGAVISGTVLSLLCFFRVMARVDNQKFFWKTVDKVWVKTVLGTALALWFTWFSGANAYDDLKNSVIFDVPILETFLGCTTIFGGFWVIKGVPYRSFLNKRVVFLTVFITLLAYGGWMWSEIIYDQQIINAFAILQKSSPP